MNKKLIFSITLSIFFIAIILSGCFSHWQGDNAKFVISFATVERAASSRNVENGDGIAPDFEHRVELTRGQEKITFSSKVNIIEAYAPEGKWTIWVYSYLAGELFALGDGEIDLQVGQMNEVRIKMRFVGVSEISITSLEINITQPVKGMTPSTEASFEDDSFTAGTVSWSPSPENNLFKGGEIYTATVTLTAKDGFTFIGLDTATINDQEAGVTDNTGTDVTLSYTFPATNEKTVTSITIYTQPSLTYTHLDTLNLDDLVVTLTYDDGSEAENVNFEDFWIKGITANPAQNSQLTYSNNNTLVTVSYGNLNVDTNNLTVRLKVIDTTAITGITAPVKGVTPSTAASVGSDNFTAGTVLWDLEGNTFLGGVTYTATVTLTAVNGFTFTGLNTATINGEIATVSNNDGTTVTLSYTFAETSKKTVTNITIKTQPAKLTYTHGDSLNLNGLEVTLEYDDTTTENVLFANFANKNITANPSQGNQLTHSANNGKSVKVNYGNLNVDTANLTVNLKTINPNIQFNSNFPAGGAMAPQNNPLGTVIQETSQQYSGTVTWSPDHTTIANGTVYTATITLTPKEGYTMEGVTENFFTINQPNSVTGATVTNAANSGIITVVFPKTYFTLNALRSWLLQSTQSDNTVDTAYTVTLGLDKNDLSPNPVDNFFTQLTQFLKSESNNPQFKNKYIKLDLDIPNNNAITTIPSETFGSQIPQNQNSVSLTLAGIIIPNSVTSIEEYAFKGCTNLASVTIPNGVTLIGKESFSGCSKLADITMPDSVTRIGEKAFDGTAWLNNPSNNNSVVYLGKALITYKGTMLQNTNITINDGTKVITDGAFKDFTNLTKINIPTSVITIGSSAFHSTGITSVDIPNSITTIEGAAFQKSQLTSITIPTSVTSIGNWSFEGCKITSVTIPNSVTSIGEAAFMCTSLTSVKFEGADTTFSTTNINSFPGDLHTKYLAAGGGIGTYIKGSDISSIWTKQP
jgi:hypothetical protein